MQPVTASIISLFKKIELSATDILSKLEQQIWECAKDKDMLIIAPSGARSFLKCAKKSNFDFLDNNSLLSLALPEAYF